MIGLYVPPQSVELIWMAFRKAALSGGIKNANRSGLHSEGDVAEHSGHYIPQSRASPARSSNLHDIRPPLRAFRDPHGRSEQPPAASAKTHSTRFASLPASIASICNAMKRL